MRRTSVNDTRLVPDRARPGSWIVRVSGTDQSYVDPSDPTYLEFDYVQRIAHIIDNAFTPGSRIMAVHVGGAGMTIPRYVAHTRPTSGQIVLEPDASLTAAVRAVAPLPLHSGIKVRALDGATGLAQLADDYADLIVVDAFVGGQVPRDLTTETWFREVRRVLRSDGILTMNITGQAPFDYARRVIAGIMDQFSPVVAGAEPSTWKGRRFGNMVISAGTTLNPYPLIREAASAFFPYHLVFGPELDRFVASARPFSSEDAQPSPPPPWTLF